MAKDKKKDIWLELFNSGYKIVESKTIFSSLLRHVQIKTDCDYIKSTRHKALCLKSGEIHINRKIRLEPEEWAYVIAHCLLHFGFWHFEDFGDALKWNLACDMYITNFLKDIKIFKVPDFVNTDFPFAPTNEREIFEKLKSVNLNEKFQGFSTGEGFEDLDFHENVNRFYRRKDPKAFYLKLFEDSLINSVSAAVGVAAGYVETIEEYSEKKITPAEKARRWFLNSYPLLGALAQNFKIIEDPQICIREEISVAAISESLNTIYINPGSGLSESELKFIIAHELLHVGLRHGSRCQGRDFYLWNVACDYVINGWLVEMKVGSLPQMGLLYDKDFEGMSAESIYDIIVKDIRKFKKLATLRGKGISDILGESEITFKNTPVSLDEFYRRAINEGLEYHKSTRGYIPLGLEEEIVALYREPISWDVKLARWFDNFFDTIEKKRTYSRASRRQSSTPDIIRPKTIKDSSAIEGRTFGVVIDTSGSMDRYMLAIALGSIGSYAESRDVPYVRVIFCDATYYDAGFMDPSDIMGRVVVRGRGGTVLQPGIDFLEKSPDFPPNGPILIITDGECDNFHCHREHAILIPKGMHLPFKPKGEVFMVE